MYTNKKHSALKKATGEQHVYANDPSIHKWKDTASSDAVVF